MKIRTDFVTNSSSSSYCVSLHVKTTEKEELSLDFWPNDNDGSGDVYVNLFISADSFAAKIKERKSVEEIKQLLLNGIDLSELFCGEFESKDNTSDFINELSNADDDYEKLSTEVTDKYNNFKKGLDKIEDIKNIESISISEYYTGWGEFARDGVDDFINAILPNDVDADDCEAVENALADKLTEEEIESIIDQIENDSICMFNANIDTTIKIADKTVTKKYSFEDMT